MKAARWLVMGGLVVALLGCAQTRVIREEPAVRQAPAPRSQAPARPVATGPSAIVKPGDTLYSISVANDADWREIARLNNIPAPYVIKPGQVLRLPGSSPTVAVAPTTRGVTPMPPQSVPTASPPSARSGGVVAGVLPTPASATPQPAAPEPAVVPSPSTTAAVSVTPAAQTPAAAPPANTAPVGDTRFVPGQWRWPTQGQVVSRFVAGDRARQGIAIAGREGQPVLAAAAGTVVYSGSGLVGYGELIIIKHDDNWLSAYGHNRRRLVAEGARVGAGQPIAELGHSGTSRDMLHFEIRQNGRPIDPSPLLPRR